MISMIKFITFSLFLLITVNFSSSLKCYCCDPSKRCELKNLTCPKKIENNILVKNFVGKTTCFSASYRVFGEKFIHKGCCIQSYRSCGDPSFVTENDVKIKEGLALLPNVDKNYFSCQEDFCNCSKKLDNNNLVVFFFQYCYFCFLCWLVIIPKYFYQSEKVFVLE